MDMVAWGAGLAILGAIVGSFVAALVVRWPAGRSVMRGRSACDACGATVRARDLVPVASGLVLRGRCRDCGAMIDPVHAWVELAAAVVGAVAGALAAGPVALAGAVFGWLLLALAMLDLRHWWLPDRLTATLALAGIAAALAGVSPDLGERLIGGAAGFVALWSIAAGYRKWRGRDGMGGGDPKMLGAIGLWLGWRMLPAVLLMASVVGLGWVAWQAARGRRLAADDAVPFGVLLAVAAYPAWLVMIASTP
ncbi:prepilin peptidase [Sphingomonas sp.]|jgi:leader peptidase (prepilin peptidase)/N-methyltransferase|uniref:prepilin peptidase n=1 Tax=Sphingomonas sp. TaxID=28214 RepID=UPI002ED970F1